MRQTDLTHGCTSLVLDRVFGSTCISTCLSVSAAVLVHSSDASRGTRCGINVIIFLPTPVLGLGVKAYFIEWAVRQMLSVTLRMREVQVARNEEFVWSEMLPFCCFSLEVRVNKPVSAANRNHSILKSTLIKKKGNSLPVIKMTVILI